MKTGVSIIIPAFNEERVIERTLSQFLPYKERFGLELIVSDDSSTDRTVELARMLADKVVRNEGNPRSRSATLNRGVAASSKDIFIFLDAVMILDDKEAFFTELDLAFGRNPEIGGGMIDFFVYPEEERWTDRLTHWFWNIVMRGFLKTGWGISTPGFQMGRRDFFTMINGFDEGLRLTQDVDYSLRLSKVAKFHYFKDARLLESPRRYRDEGYWVYAYRSSLRWFSILFRKKSYGEYKVVR